MIQFVVEIIAVIIGYCIVRYLLRGWKDTPQEMSKSDKLTMALITLKHGDMLSGNQYNLLCQYFGTNDTTKWKV